MNAIDPSKLVLVDVSGLSDDVLALAKLVDETGTEEFLRTGKQHVGMEILAVIVVCSYQLFPLLAPDARFTLCEKVTQFIFATLDLQNVDPAGRA